jgi:hypothetical protein
LLQRILLLLLMATAMGAIVEWSARRARPDRPADFFAGMLHGALMPASMPSLLLGRDVTIYALPNTGIRYKLGYTVGVNVCGALFFGIFYRHQRHRHRHRHEPAAAATPVAPTAPTQPT